MRTRIVSLAPLLRVWLVGEPVPQPLANRVAQLGRAAWITSRLRRTGAGNGSALTTDAFVIVIRRRH